MKHLLLICLGLVAIGCMLIFSPILFISMFPKEIIREIPVIEKVEVEKKVYTPIEDNSGFRIGKVDDNTYYLEMPRHSAWNVSAVHPSDSEGRLLLERQR